MASGKPLLGEPHLAPSFLLVAHPLFFPLGNLITVMGHCQRQREQQECLQSSVHSDRKMAGKAVALLTVCCPESFSCEASLGQTTVGIVGHQGDNSLLMLHQAPPSRVGQFWGYVSLK